MQNDDTSKKCHDNTCPRAHLELGQALFGNPTGDYDLPEYAGAMWFVIWSEIARVYSNRTQQPFNIKYGTNPEIPGIEVRAYYWGADPIEATKPNFTLEGVEIRWYKYVGRGMTCNVQWTPDQWVTWFTKCLELIRAHDVC